MIQRKAAGRRKRFALRAFATVVDRDAGGVSLAFVAVGHAVTAAHRIPDSGAAARNRCAGAQEVAAAKAHGRFAELVGVFTGDACDAAADLPAATFAIDVGARRGRPLGHASGKDATPRMEVGA